MLNKKLHYLQIALNSTPSDARDIITRVPVDERIIFEAGTPLIKEYGAEVIRKIRNWCLQRVGGFGTVGETQYNLPPIFNLISQLIEKKKAEKVKETKVNTGVKQYFPYIVADLKAMDRGGREVKIAYENGANAVTVLGNAPIETIDACIAECEKFGLDAMVDMMNVDFPLSVLRKLKKQPPVVIVHRGVDEEAFNKEKMIPFHEINRIKGNYNIMLSIAGGDTIREVQRAVFNNADIVVVWKMFYDTTQDTARLASEFLKIIK